MKFSYRIKRITNREPCIVVCYVPGTSYTLEHELIKTVPFKCNDKGIQLPALMNKRTNSKGIKHQSTEIKFR